MLVLHAVPAFLVFVPLVFANTEIVNFAVQVESDIQPPPQWQVLDYQKAEILRTLVAAPLGTEREEICNGFEPWAQRPCPHEMWLVLDLGDEKWHDYAKFTLRLSWPASNPVDFFLDVFDDDALLQTLVTDKKTNSTSTKIQTTSNHRRNFARVRVVDTGVRNPQAKKPTTVTTTTTTTTTGNFDGTHDLRPVSFILQLEPLSFGVLPISLIPTLVTILVVCSALGTLIPSINRHLDGLARRAQQELKALNKE